MLGLVAVVLILIVAGVFSCSRLPTIVPDLAGPPAPPVQLVGRHGPLSAARSKAILDKLQKRGEGTGIFDRHLALEEAITGSPLTTGNKVLLLKDGPETYRAMLAAILDARDHINMETYILDDDDVGRQFARALMDKQIQGIQANLIQDSVGTPGDTRRFLQAAHRYRHQCPRVQPGEPAAGAQGMGSESAGPSSVRKWTCVRVPPDS